MIHNYKLIHWALTWITALIKHKKDQELSIKENMEKADRWVKGVDRKLSEIMGLAYSTHSFLIKWLIAVHWLWYHLRPYCAKWEFNLACQRYLKEKPKEPRKCLYMNRLFSDLVIHTQVCSMSKFFRDLRITKTSITDIQLQCRPVYHKSVFSKQTLNSH